MTQIIQSLQEWKKIRQNLSPTQSLGLVPTLGNLHVGHQSLLEQSRQHNDATILSIYVNPTQFNDPKDFECYPRTFSKDIELAEKMGIDFVLMPEENSLYPDHYRYRIEETELSQILEGQYRPGHFAGVLTIVFKLFQIVKPTRVYFGEKDYQQLMLIRGMIDAFLMDIEMVPCATIREADQLPYSSRNARLSVEHRRQASQFPAIFFQNKSCGKIKEELLAAGFEVDYIEDYQQRRYGAVRVGGVRLLDNYELYKETPKY